MKIDLIMTLDLPEEKVEALEYKVPKASRPFKGMLALEHLFVKHAESLSRCLDRAMETKILCDDEQSEEGYGTTGFVGEEVDWIPY